MIQRGLKWLSELSNTAYYHRARFTFFVGDIFIVPE
jgi:hypothetical protein